MRIRTDKIVVAGKSGKGDIGNLKRKTLVNSPVFQHCKNRFTNCLNDRAHNFRLKISHLKLFTLIVNVFLCLLSSVET